MAALRRYKKEHYGTKGNDITESDQREAVLVEIKGVLDRCAQEGHSPEAANPPL
jgi:hypothetical protein